MPKAILDAIFTETLDLLNMLNTRDGRFDYADYVALHNNITDLYESFMDAEAEKPKWISVNERLPESGSTVLTYVKHNYCDTDGWRAYRVYDYTDHWVGMGNLCEVIAWMPLPEPPEREEKDND